MTWIWMILWGILWLLLGILALVVAIMLLIIILLAIPIRYDVRATTGEDAGNTAFVKVSYLLRLVRMVYEYRDGVGKFKVKVLFFTLGKKRKKGGTVGVVSVRPNISPRSGDSKTSGLLRFARNDELPPKKDFFKTINTVLTYPNRKIIIDLMLQTAKKMLKILKPKRFLVTGTVGFSDPSTTGLFVGACEAAVEYFDIRKNVQLGGNFDTSKTEARLKINVKGSVSIARMALPIIRLWLKKPIRTLIRDMKNY